MYNFTINITNKVIRSVLNFVLLITNSKFVIIIYVEK